MAKKLHLEVCFVKNTIKNSSAKKLVGKWSRHVTRPHKFLMFQRKLQQDNAKTKSS